MKSKIFKSKAAKGVIIMITFGFETNIQMGSELVELINF
jgi:hypothetical protein